MKSDSNSKVYPRTASSGVGTKANAMETAASMRNTRQLFQFVMETSIRKLNVNQVISGENGL